MKWTISQEDITCERFNCKATVRTVIYANEKAYREVECEKNCKDCKYGRTQIMRIKDILKSLEGLELTDL